MGIFKRELSEESKRSYSDAASLYSDLVSDFPASEDGIEAISNAKTKSITEDEFKEIVISFINKNYKCDENILDEVVDKYLKLIFSYSILTELIQDPYISDIKVISYDNIRIKAKGKRQGCDIKFSSVEEYKAFIDYVTTKNHVNASQRNSIQRFTDVETDPNFILRFTLSMETTNTYDWPLLSIRKVPKNFPSIDELTVPPEEGGPGMMNEELKKVLIERFNNGGTLICGGNSSGKTTILNALKETIAEDKSVLICQQADELTTKKHPDMIFMHSLPGNSEVEIAYNLKDISIAGLTMDIDFIIIGETKGDEASDLLKAVYSGQLGATTVHSPSAHTGLHKVADYALSAPDNHYTKVELMRMLGDCFKTVIYMKNYKVDQVVAIRGYNETTQDIDYFSIWENGIFTNE